MALFGKDTDGASTNSSSVDRKAASSFTPRTGGVVQSMTFRCWLDAAGTSNMKGFIYSDLNGSPDTLLAVTDEIAVTATAEQANTANFTGANQITITANKPYWLGYIWSDPSTPNVVRSQDGTANQQASLAETYSTGPNAAWGTVTLVSGPLDVYVTYIADGGVGNYGNHLIVGSGMSRSEVAN